MLGENTFMDTVMDKILNATLTVMRFILDIIFLNNGITLLFWFVFINGIAILLMKKDKEYAKQEKRRIKESTLLLVAFVGGALGMYYAMYHYKHKTLHKKFTIFVPICILLHFAFVSYFLVNSFMI